MVFSKVYNKYQKIVQKAQMYILYYIYMYIYYICIYIYIYDNVKRISNKRSNIKHPFSQCTCRHFISQLVKVPATVSIALVEIASFYNSISLVSVQFLKPAINSTISKFSVAAWHAN